MKELSTISELKELIDSNRVSKVYIQIIENVFGYYQLKEGVVSEKEPIKVKDWNELEGSPTDVGTYNPDKPTYEGYFDVTNQHEVTLDWFIEKFNGFINSDFDYEDDYNLFHYQFIDYGREEGLFDVNSEMGLHGPGLKYGELRKTMKITLSTYGQGDYNYIETGDIETGLICGSDGEDVIWYFD